MEEWNPDAYLDRLRALLLTKDVTTAGAVPRHARTHVDSFEALGRAIGERTRQSRASLHGSPFQAFVDGFASAARGLAVASVRAADRGFIDTATSGLEDEQQVRVLQALCDRQCALGERIGLTATALRRIPVLYVSASDYDRLVATHPELTASIMKHLALMHPRDPGGAVAAFERRRAEIAVAFPDLPASSVEHFALRQPKDPIAAVEEYLEECTALSARYPMLQPGTIRYFVMRNPAGRAEAIERLIEQTNALREEFPDAEQHLLEVSARKRPGDPRSFFCELMAKRQPAHTQAASSRGSELAR